MLSTRAARSGSLRRVPNGRSVLGFTELRCRQVTAGTHRRRRNADSAPDGWMISLFSAQRSIRIPTVGTGPYEPISRAASLMASGSAGER